jgi:hypothetical protein
MDGTPTPEFFINQECGHYRVAATFANRATLQNFSAV